MMILKIILIFALASVSSSDPTNFMENNPQVKRRGVNIRLQASSPQKKVKLKRPSS